MSDTEIAGTPAYSHYSTDALLPNEYIFLFADDFARGNEPGHADSWVLVTGCVRLADDAGWSIFTILPSGEEFVHGRHNPTVIRAVDGAVPHVFNPATLAVLVAGETARVEAAQAKLDRLRKLRFYVDALSTARLAADSRRGQKSVQGV